MRVPHPFQSQRKGWGTRETNRTPQTLTTCPHPSHLDQLHPQHRQPLPSYKALAPKRLRATVVSCLYP
jgi:hypothetical protein